MKDVFISDRRQDAKQVDALARVLMPLRQALGEQHRGTVTRMGDLAVTHRQSGEHSTMLQLMLSVAKGLAHLLGADDPHAFGVRTAIEQMGGAPRRQAVPD